MARARAGEDFVALEHAFHGMARHLREFAGAELVREYVELAAEAAADHRLDDAHLALGHAEPPGDPETAHIGPLRRRPDGPLAVLVFRRRAVRLDGGVDHLLRLIVMPVGVIGLGEGFVRFARPHRREDRKIVSARIVDRLRLRLHRVEGVEDDRQRLVFDLNERGGLRGDILSYGADGGDLVADHAHLFTAERLLVGQLLEGFGVAEVVPFGKVASREHALDTRQPERLGKVDAFDERVRVGAVDEFAVIHAGQVDVVGVDGAPRHLRLGVDAHVGVALARQLVVLGLFIDAFDLGVIFL